MSLIEVQQEYIDAVNAAIARWDHRPDGGHSHRTIRHERRVALTRLAGMGYTDSQAFLILADADDMARLTRNSTED